MLKDQAERTRVIESTADCFISAGAGTGKSTLIAEKICHLLGSEHGCGITEFAAITFTKSAAEVLKNKIKKNIHKKLNDEKITSKTRLKLQKCLDQFEQCRISTIHSFCASWLREYSLQLEIDPRFEVLESSSLLEELTQFLSRYLKNLYQNREDLAPIYKIWNHLQKYEQISFEKLTEKVTWLYDRIDVLNKADEDLFLIKDESELNELKTAVFREHRDRFLVFVKSYSSQEDRHLQEIVRHIQKYDNWEECIRKNPLEPTIEKSKKNIFHHPKLAPKQNPGILKYHLKVFSGKDKNIKLEELPSIVKRGFVSHVLPGKIIYSPKLLIHEYLRWLWYKAVTDLDEKFKEDRKQRSLFSYQDLLTTMLELLSFEPYRNEIKSKLKYLFVDEYQDVDEVQREIFQLLTSSEGSKNILFIRVGDPNQSIYSFRGARHDKFLREESLSKSHKIIESVTLDVNMRSHSKVLSFINWLFESRSQNGSVSQSGTNANGDGNHLFQKLKSYIRLHGRKDQCSDANKPGIFIPIISGAEEDDEKNTGSEAHDETKKGVSYYRSLEAGCIAQIINENKAKNKDSKTAILFRVWSNIGIYTKALRDQNLSYSIIGRSEFGESHLLRSVLYILKLVLNPNDKASLIGILRSPLVGLKDEDIEHFVLSSRLKLIDPYKKPRIDNKVSYWKPLNRFLEKLLFLCHERLSHTLEEFIYLLFNSFNMAEMMNLENTSNVIMQIFQGVKEIDASCSDQDERLERLIDSIDSVLEEGGLLSGSGQAAMGQNIQLMSIHASKGLEFDTIFLADTIYNLGASARSSDFFIEANSEGKEHEKILFFKKGDLSFADPERDSPLQRQRQRDEEESARLLYVALTRARNRIYFPLTSMEPKRQNASYQNWVLESFLSRASLDPLNHEAGVTTLLNGSEVFIEPRNIQPSNGKQATRKKRTLKIKKAEPGEMSSYHFISASMLWEKQRTVFGETDYSMRISAEEISPRKRGNLIHKAFEWLDLDLVRLSDEARKALIASFDLSGSASRTASSLINDALSKFKNSQLFSLIQKGVIKGREIPFSGLTKNSKYDLKKKIAIGYLDLLVYLPEGFTIQKRRFDPGLYLIDYKTNEIPANVSEKAFQTSLLEEYRIGIRLYLDILQSYYETCPIKACLYHTSSGKLLFYDQP